LQTEPVATCRDLVRSFPTGSGRVDALKGVDATFYSRAVTAVIGPSGSGKSSLLRILAGLDRPTEGNAVVGGIDVGEASSRALRSLRRRVGYVFQRPTDNLISYLTLEQHLWVVARLRRTDVDIPAILGPLGLADRARHRPEELSGGEQQRAALAQAIVGDPLLVIADEPTAELDSATSEGLLGLLKELPRRGLAVVMSTHDPAALEIADNELRLHHGEVERP
jgi:putative ABC transport system ATP-binding protein